MHACSVVDFPAIGTVRELYQVMTTDFNEASQEYDILYYDVPGVKDSGEMTRYLANQVGDKMLL